MTLSFSQTQALKGLAIIAVVSIHIMAFFPTLYINSPVRDIAATFDQIFRISVPLFITLSGYGLAKSQGKNNLSWLIFFKKRALKLLPAYIIWTAISLLLASLVPVWAYPNRTPSLFALIFLGQADYHLYFIPIIFQLYLVFPLLYKVIKKFPKIVWVFLLMQAMSYIYYAQTGLSERTEYILLTSWIGYFALGIGLTSIIVKKWMQYIIVILTVFGLFFTTYIALSHMSAGINPLDALKFTRWQLLLFTIPATVSFCSLSSMKVLSILGQIGKYSFVLYLGHVYFLRIVYAVLTNQIAWPLLTFGILIWCVGMLATVYMENHATAHKQSS